NQLTELRLELGSLLAPIAQAAVGFGTTLLNAVNSLPGPLREVFAGFSLIGPAIAVLGAAYALHAAKAFVVAKAVDGLIRPLKELSVAAKIPTIGKGLDTIADIAKRVCSAPLLAGSWMS